MKYADSVNYPWSLRPTQLRAACEELAHGDKAGVDAALQKEAAQLAVDWKDAMGILLDNGLEESRRASQIAALRRRTIEILVKAHRGA